MTTSNMFARLVGAQSTARWLVKSCNHALRTMGMRKKNLLLFRFAERGRLGQGEEHDLLAGYGADIVVQAQHLDAGDLRTITSMSGRAVSIS